MEDFRVRMSLWLIKASGKAWRENAVDSLPDLQSWLLLQDQSGWSLRMSQGCLIVETDKISKMSSKHWMTSGISWRGEYWTQSILEHPKDAVVCSLSQVIKATAPHACFLSTEHLVKWLERAKYRSAPLPSSLETAFRSQICLQSNMPPLEESLPQGRKRKDTESRNTKRRFILRVNDHSLN